MGSEIGVTEAASSVIPDVVPAATIALDKDGRITALNELAARLLGRSRTAVVGQPLHDLFGREASQVLQDHLETTASAEGLVRCEIDVANKDGSFRHVLIQSIAVRRPDAEEVAFRCVLLDLTAHAERLEDAESGRVAAERVARSKTDFLARLSHEIRSALASMVGFADMLSDSVPDAREMTDIIRDSGRHLLDTLNSVMDLARLEFQEGDVELHEVDVVVRLRARAAMFEKLAAARGLTFSFRAEADSASAQLNDTFLDRIVHNLVDNAIKYTPSGRVELSVEKRDGQVWIYVADTGVGIRKEFLPRLFSPFEREKRDAATDGVGLGLAITKYLVELMKGRITACSTPDEGSTFTVSFPAV